MIKLNRAPGMVSCAYIQYPPGQSPSPGESSADDFLESLLGGSDSSSAPASPLWYPCTTNSAISDVTYPAESPPSLRPVSEFTPSKMELHPSPGKVKMENTSDVCIDLGETTDRDYHQLLSPCRRINLSLMKDQNKY